MTSRFIDESGDVFVDENGNIFVDAGTLSNPLTPARQWLYDKLKASTVLSTAGVTVYPEWPQEGTLYPMCFLSRSGSRLVSYIGVNVIHDNSTWNVNIVGDRRTLLSTMDLLLDEVITQLHRTLGTNSKGTISSCSVEEVLDLPYRVNDDWYPRRIVQCQVYAAGN